MFEDSVRDKRSSDDVEGDLTEIIQRKVAPDIIATATDLLSALAEVDRMAILDKQDLDPANVEGIAAVNQRAKSERAAIMVEFDSVSEEIRIEISADATTRTLLNSLSSQKSCHRSAVRDALHLIKDAQSDNETLGSSAELEMTGATA
jgi:hypothetical protein